MEKILKDATKIEKVRKTAQNLRRALEAAEKSKSTRVHQQQVSREINMLEDKLRRVASSEGLDSAVKQVVGEKQDVREQEEARRKNVPLRVIKREKKASEEPRDNSWLVAPKQDQWGQEVARGKRKMIGYYDYGVHQQEPAWKYHPKIKQDTIDFRKEEKQFAKLPADSSWNLLPSSRPHAWTVAPPSSDAGARKTREHMAPAAGRAVKEEGARREVKVPQARSSLPSPPSSPSFSSPSSTSPVRSDERLDGPLARTAANLKMLMREAMRSKDVPAVASAAPALGDVSLRSSLKRMNQDFDLEAQAERRVQEQLSSFDGLGGSGEREAPAGLLSSSSSSSSSSSASSSSSSASSMPRRRQRRYSRRTVNLRSMKERLVAAEDAARLAPPAGRAEIQRDLRELRLAYDVAKMSANAERENKREVGEMRRDASQV